MAVPPLKKSKMEAATSGVIIIDPAAFPEKKVVPSIAKELYLLPPHNKNITLTTTKPSATTMVRTLPKLSNTSNPPQAPLADNTQNRNLKDLTAVTNKSTQPLVNKVFNIDRSKPITPTIVRIMPKLPNAQTVLQKSLPGISVIKKIETPQTVYAAQQKLPTQMSLLIKRKPVEINPLLKQTTAQPNQQALKSGEEAHLSHPNQSQKQIQLSHSIKSVKLLEQQQQTNKAQTELSAPKKLDPGMQYFEFINEAVFDYEETVKKQVIAVGDSDDDSDVSGIEEKALEYVLHIPKSCSVTTETQPIEYATASVQTDQADDDRVYCGFVNVTKDGSDKYFNLRCFYCEAEYPISFYGEFSEHIIETHGDMEKVYVENEPAPADEPEVEPNSEPEFNFFNDSDSSDGITPEELPPVNLFADLIDRGNRETELTLVKKKSDSYVKELLPEDFDDGDETCSASEGENYYLSVDKYDPNLDHSYSQSSFNKIVRRLNCKPEVLWRVRLSNQPAYRASNMKLMSDEEPVDEITFGKTSPEIVMDLLNRLKGFQSLWRDRSLAPISYDNELLDLMDIMIDKWSLNLKKRCLRKNLENIKAWYIGMTVSKEELGAKFYEHKFIEYYNKCAEYLPAGDTSKLQKIMCDVCNRFCYDLNGLQVHKWRKHRIGRLPYGCNRCNKRFDIVHKLLNHARTHMVKPTIDRHVAPPITERPLPAGYTCAECNEKFPVWDEFKKHLELHPKGDCPYLCLDCGHRFRTNNLRTSHQRRHQEPAYPCELCPKKFYFAYHLKQHMIIHKGADNFVCEWCGKTFIRQTKFKEHLQYAHYGRGICNICNRHYHKRSILSKHLKNMHRPLIGTIEELTRRRRVFNSNGNRKGKGTGPRLSTRKYTYIADPVTQKRRIVCPKCDKSYKQYDSLYAHYKKVHGSRVQENRRRPTANKKLSKPRKKRAGKAVSNDTSDMDVEAEAEATTAVNSITENAAIKLDHTNVSSASTSKAIVDNRTTAQCSIVEVQIKNEKNITTTISFEKFVDDIALSNNFALQSPNRMPPLLGGYEHTPEKTGAPAASGVKNEDFVVGDYEFLLNSSSDMNFS